MLKERVRLFKFRFQNLNKEKFCCPICRYNGPFKDINPPIGFRKHAQCPKCFALERHRLQYLVIKEVILKNMNNQLRMLHFAPEKFFKNAFRNRFNPYETSDLLSRNVDFNADLQNLPFKEAVYDFIFASHVLEHIPDDTKAISEIRRILKPGGIAILPVPLVSLKTVEYPHANLNEFNHVRAPGFDYFERYKPFFSRVDEFSSDSMPYKYQLFIYENRSRWPTKECPDRTPMEGEKHIDIVPVCYA